MNVYEMLAYESARTFFGPWLTFVFRVKTEGKENLPKDSGALLICNRHNILDTLALMTEVDRYIHFLAGSHGFVVPVVKTLYHMTGMARLSLKGAARSGKGIDEAVGLMKDGEIVGVFPEGIELLIRPDRGGKIFYFRTNFVRMALEAGVPIIPAAVIPGDDARRILVRIGRPIDLSGFKDEPLTKRAIDVLSGKLRRVVIKLYNGEDMERFVTGDLPFDIYTDRV
ncbi:MAG: hypothetical protein CVT63_05965 [Candidatus Anoxymicrobium japonicum]|uniref:Phospholipid/glycerol acyltransferase domain-containing protein n=1 Tax=Candidatus Anoxymicrobium japonicum TaxID=2013648 RepID=A0A2N3G528_9ACTN|nr:MAG: hypothetical protein CVT63_05965 [Candidatus Anoxymicrobium japonicum]